MVKTLLWKQSFDRLEKIFKKESKKFTILLFYHFQFAMHKVFFSNVSFIWHSSCFKTKINRILDRALMKIKNPE